MGTKEITIYKRKETVQSDAAVSYRCDQTGFKITVSDPVEIGEDNLVLFEAETIEEGVGSMTYARVSPEELVAMGYKLIAAGEMFKKGTKIDVEA
jgi:hypothetical protein